MKSIKLFTLIVIAFACTTNNSDQLGIIPQPRHIREFSGVLSLPQSVRINYSPDFEGINKVVEYLGEKFSSGLGREIVDTNRPTDADIIFRFDDKVQQDEGYKLTVDNSIIISSKSAHGAFYGAQTLLQLLPPEVFGSAGKSVPISIPKLEIEDYPEFKWRGMHLDVGRHFFPVEDIKKYIDYLAIHKMNRFHWHLTEDQGWRIEIKKYPKLTTISSFRKETMGDGIPYGGFYSQEEIREVVKYASDRFIEVVPEIEMPGHSVAVLAAYPELACTAGPFEVETEWGVHPDVYCAGKDTVFSFLENVLTEVMELFPGEYIHIGGDECPKDRWKKCPDCQARISKEGLKDENELQSYFIKRIEKFINKNGKRLIGWDEILEGGLPPEATVMSWRGMEGGLKAVAAGHSVVMTPTSNCYFDYYQGTPEFEPPAIGGFLPLSKVYAFNPIPDTLASSKREYILGSQGNVWTEYMDSFSHIEYMVFPRIAAMSEVVWVSRDEKDFSSFMRRLPIQLKRYKAMGINYSESVYRISVEETFDSDSRNLSISLTSELENPVIRFTLDGTEPTHSSSIFTAPIPISESCTLKAVLELNGALERIVTTKNYEIHKAFGKDVKYLTPFNDVYSAGGNFGLVDGVRGSAHFRDGRWQGFLGEDLETIVDFGEKTSINSISVGCLQRMISSIFFPKSVEFFVSENGENFEYVGKVVNNISTKNGEMMIKDFTISGLDKKARYLKVTAANLKICPEWHRNAGRKSWIFADEIVVR